jgi:hypothetical protein
MTCKVGICFNSRALVGHEDVVEETMMHRVMVQADFGRDCCALERAGASDDWARE